MWVCRVLNYTDYLLTETSLITGYVYISAFVSLVGIPIGITSSATELKIYAITAVIRKHQSIIKKKHNKIILLTKSTLNSIEVLISKALINSNISHDGFVLINNVLKEFYGMKKKKKRKILMTNKSLKYI